MTDTDTDKEQKQKYILYSAGGMGLITYLMTKDLKISAVGAGIGGYYVYNNFENVKEQVKDITGDTDGTENGKVGDREWYEKAIDYSPSAIAGQFWSSIF